MTKKTASLHPRNIHQGRYDMKVLVQTLPELAAFITENPRGEQTINFSDDKAVLCLNKALLAHHYQVLYWQIPEGYLCPPIPGRADYIHVLADILAESNHGEIPTGKQVKALDVGTGANCIYPIIGTCSYGWHFTASDIDPVSVKTATAIAQANACLTKNIKVVLQKQVKHIFTGIIQPKSRYAVTLCNPPFHASMAEAKAGTERKLKNLSKTKSPVKSQKLNFGGQKAELWCEGGEIRFLQDMISESKLYAEQVCWFTSLVSKGDNLPLLQRSLRDIGAKEVKVVTMAQGQKISRLIAWSFLSKMQRLNWFKHG